MGIEDTVKHRLRPVGSTVKGINELQCSKSHRTLQIMGNVDFDHCPFCGNEVDL